MAEFQLYCFAQSGNAYKVGLLLNLLRADWAPIFVDYFNGATREPSYRSDVNAMGEVPVLVHKGQKFTQSGAILHYVAAQSGQFGGTTDADRYEILRWILFDNHKFTSYLATHRFLNAFTKDPDPAVMSFLQGRVVTALGIAEQQLSTQRFIAGDQPTIADISMCGYLFYPREELGIDVADGSPAIARWLERIRQLPGWAHPYDLLPGHPIPQG